MDILNFISWLKSGRQVSTVDPSKAVLPIGIKTRRRDDGYQPVGISVEDFLKLAGVDGTSFILVQGKGTKEENGQELISAYALGKASTPFGEALSDVNRFTVIVAPGEYLSDQESPTSPSTTEALQQFVFDADYVDVVSLTGNADVYLSGITVAAKNIHLVGLNTKYADQVGISDPFFSPITAFNLYITGADQRFEKCVGGDFSFGFGGIVDGTFIDCEGGSYSFCSIGANSAPQGVTDLTFMLPFSEASGTFTRCIAGDMSFGSSFFGAFPYGMKATGTFIDCTAKADSFGTGALASGTFTGCKASNNSFGGYGLAQSGDAAGVFENCTGGDYSFAGGNSAMQGGSANGTFRNCTAGDLSFGYYAFGVFSDCKAGAGSFGLAIFRGEARNCEGGENCFNGNFIGDFSGVAYYCVAGSLSFSEMANSFTGYAYYCKTAGTFPTPLIPGKIVLGIDGSNTVITT